MKKNLLFLCFLFLLFSCTIDSPNNSSGPTSLEGITATGVVAGKVTANYGTDYYQFLGIISNQSQETKEFISIRIDWLDSLGHVLISDSRIIPRLEQNQRCPVWIKHSSSTEVSKLTNFKNILITYVSAYSDDGTYTTNLKLNNIQFLTDTGRTRVKGTLVNNSPYRITNAGIRAASVSSAGKCVEYGIESFSGMTIDPGATVEVDFTFIKPTGTPSTTFFYCYGERMN